MWQASKNTWAGRKYSLIYGTDVEGAKVSWAFIQRLVQASRVKRERGEGTGKRDIDPIWPEV